MVKRAGVVTPPERCQLRSELTQLSDDMERMLMSTLNVKLNEIPYKGSPRPTLDLLSAVRQSAVADPDVRKRLDGMGISVVSVERARPQALRAHLKNEMDTLDGLLIKAGVQAN